jgi:hypothetical protein
VATFDLILGLPTPPPGATLAVVPTATLARFRITDGTERS